jgi:hypothetical protein
MAMYSCMMLPLSKTAYSIFEAENLSKEDRRSCIMAIQSLKITQFRHNRFLLDIKPASKCPAPQLDALRTRELFTNIIDNASSGFLSESFGIEPDICDKRLVLMKKTLLQERREAWESIPNIYRCEEWCDLMYLRQKTCG